MRFVLCFPWFGALRFGCKFRPIRGCSNLSGLPDFSTEFLSATTRQRIWFNSRTRVQSAAVPVANFAPFSDTCAKCGRPGAELGSVFEHVCKVRPSGWRTWLRFRTRVPYRHPYADERSNSHFSNSHFPRHLSGPSAYSSYSSNTCAKCSQPLQAVGGDRQGLQLCSAANPFLARTLPRG